MRNVLRPHATVAAIALATLSFTLNASESIAAATLAAVRGTLAPAEFRNVIAGPNDVLTVTHNRTTHAVVSLFGYGIGLYDVNAIESNDHPHQALTPERPKEEVATKSGLSDLGLPPQSIADIRYSPDSEIVGISDNALGVYALDSRKGVLDLRVVLPSTIDRAGELVFTSGNARFDALKTAVLAAYPDAIARFNSSALYRSPAGRSYMLIPALQYGLLVAEVGSVPLTADSFADVVWLPDGAYSVRVLERSNLAVLIDGRGFAHLLDLADIDERGDVTTPAELFPTATASIADKALDPRILWTSDAPVAQGAGFVPPIIDPDTGMMYSGDLLGRRVRVGSAKDPKVRIVADTGSGTGLKEVGSIVPLGVAPPVPLSGPNASLAAFRIEVSLPGSMQESAGGELGVAIESERISGFDSVPQTPSPYPRAHLRRTKRDDTPDARPVTVKLRRALDDAAAYPELRFQRGWNRFVSDWIVAIADPRAAKDYGPAPTDCVSCTRPEHLQNAPDVHELLAGGRFIAIRGDFPSSGAYSFLSPRLSARVNTTPADTVRPAEALVAAQHPPVAEGMLQETTYLHSGEVETAAVDYDAGGRAGWNVLIDRTYRSRTIGLTPFGAGWDSALFRRLRALPNGDVEYRDGAEIWRFKLEGNAYVAPEGLFVRLVRQDTGWSLIDQRLRVTRFDDYGRIVSESDEFYDPRDSDSGNTIVYLYDSAGHLKHVVDPVGRATTLDYDTATGRVEKITDWHDATPRVIDYDYENGTLTAVQLPDVPNTSGTRPTIRYAYEPAGSGYKPQLELATNLNTITDPGIAAARVDFTYDTATDRVTSQKWATNETASFTYNLPASATITDVLGQQRTYTFTGANSATNPIADRAHVASITEQVEVWTAAPAGQLPPAIAPTAPSISTVTRTRQFSYENGALKSSEIAGLRKTGLGWEPAPGAPGLRMKSQTTQPAPGGGAASSFLPSSSAITQTLHYQKSAGAFLEAMDAGGKKIDTPEPHRYQKEPPSANDGIQQTAKYDKNGLFSGAESSGGTDPAGAGAVSSTDYWPAGAAPHLRGMPRVSREGDLETTYEYPSETTTIVTDPRKVKTTTELDTWNRPKRITIEKPGDPLVITESYTYDASGRVRNVVRSREGGDVTTTYVYDDMGRQKQVSVDQIATVGSMTTKTNYDLAARRITTENAGGATTTVELDPLGRTKQSFTNAGSSTIDRRFAYDLAGNRVFSTDLLTASASAFDIHGRNIGTMHADETVTTTTYDDWSRATVVRQLADDKTEVVGESTFDYTDAGRMKSATTRVDAALSRATSMVWDGGGRTTGIATNGRASRSQFDVAGRFVRSSVGAGDPLNIADIFHKTENDLAAFDGWLPQKTTTTEKGATAPVTSTAKHDVTGASTENTIGQLTWKQSYDEIGNIKAASVPGRPASTFKTDARGAVERETLPDGAVNQYAYHGSGAQESYTDPASEATSTINDLLGRPTRRTYADGTSEIIEWEGSRVRAVTDRQGRKQTYSYNTKGQLAEVLDGNTVIDHLTYDTAGRLVSWKNADTEVTWSDFDLEGRPKRTSQKRFRDASGLTPAPVVLDAFEQTHTYNEHGERRGFTMPAYAGMTFGAGWTQSVQLGYDAVGNLNSILRGGAPLMTAGYRNAGRPATRTVMTTAGAPIVRSYGYDETSSLLNRMSVDANGVMVAGSAVTHNGLQLESAKLLGVSSGERYIHWRYDARSRVSASVSGVGAGVDPLAAVPGRVQESQTPADFRTAQPRTSRFDAPTAAALEAKGIDTGAIDPPTATFQEQTGHKIAEAAKGPQVRPFGWNGAERIDDGRFVYEFDAKGRLLRASEKGTVAPLRRFVYTYSGTGRVVGRRAEYTAVAPPAAADWKLEDRASFLDADGMPAETTFVWDPISDNLLAVFKTAPTSADANSGLLKQIIHGGAAYDDPIETTSAGPNGVTHLYPVYDEASAGSLQIVLNDSAAVVARMLPNDPYGGENVDFNGAAIDRIAVQFVKDTSEELLRVEVTIHATEQLDAASLASGVRLATVDANGNPVRTSSVVATLDTTDAFTARWTLTPAEWATLSDPSPAIVNGAPLTPVSLSVAATATLRAAAWALETPLMPAPEWAVAKLSVFTDRHPVEVREPLPSLADATSRTLYAVEDLSLLGVSGSDTLIEDIAAARFHALPFIEPATGLIYVRERWFDPSTGTFLSPDPEGYADSSNLYAFCGGDPVNCRDPRGERAMTSEDQARIADLKAFGTWLHDEFHQTGHVQFQHFKRVRIPRPWWDTSGAIGGDYRWQPYTWDVTTQEQYETARRILVEAVESYEAAVRRADADGEIFYVPGDGFRTVTAADREYQERTTWIAAGTFFATNFVPQMLSPYAMKGTVTARPVTNYKGNGPVPVSHAEAEGWVRDVPNQWGKKGSPAHQRVIDAVEADIIARGLRPRREFRVDTPGGKKDYRDIDIVAIDPVTGRVVEIHQVGKGLKSNIKKPVVRERDAMRDLRNKPPVQDAKRFFHPYNE